MLSSYFWEIVVSILKKLEKNSLLHSSHDFVTDCEYEVMMGSVAYNVSDDLSDVDVHAICIPTKEIIFPHTVGYIKGFGSLPPDFQTFQQHHMKMHGKEYDVAVYSIIKLFSLAMDNNPNVLDMLWVKDNCILHITEIGKYIRKIRKHFLSKASYHRFRGYAYSQLKKLENSPRQELIDEHGFDTKHAYHILRNMWECKQILETGDMDITSNSEVLKSIRRGEWSLEKVKETFEREERILDELYSKSTLQYSADENLIKQFLFNCLEMKFGSLSQFETSVNLQSDAERKLIKIKDILSE